MKLLYLAEWDAFASDGVIRKIRAQYGAWRAMGIDARLVVVSPNSPDRRPPLLEGDGVTVVTHSTGQYGLAKLYKARAIRSVNGLVDEFKPDAIYYRQSSWTPGIVHLLRKAKIAIAEINSSDTNEVHQYGWLKARYHLSTRRLLIESVAGFVCVGNDVARGYSSHRKPLAVIPNGFDTASVVPRSPPRNKRPRLVFVGTAKQAWHGVDKIVSMALRLPGFDFHIVGDTLTDAPGNVYSHGHVDWGTLDEIYRSMDIGIASLALHRIKVHEISPLKTREYLAYGLPVITAYSDPDLLDCDFCLQVPNEEDGVRNSLDKIAAFVTTWCGRPIDMNWVQQHVDAKAKERMRLAFIREVLRQCS